MKISIGMDSNGTEIGHTYYDAYLHLHMSLLSPEMAAQRLPVEAGERRYQTLRVCNSG